jgi:xylose isomerase
VTSLRRDQILLSIKTNFTAGGWNMDKKEKRKSFTISDKINILVQVDAHIGTNDELASC